MRLVTNLHTELLQCIQGARHRAFACPGISVKGDRAERQCGKWRNEPHDGAGETAVDINGPGELLRRSDCKYGFVAFAGLLNINAEFAQRTHHQLRVASEQRTAQHGRLVRNRSEDELAVRQ